MGQVCSGTKEESSKGGILDVPSSGDASESSLQAGDNGNSNYSASVPSEDPSATGIGAGNGAGSNNNTSAANANANAAANENNDNNNSTNTTAQQRAAEAARADAERRKRRELWIVNGAARGMVAVRSTRGSTGYYDQGFASLLAQHLEQTTSFPDRLPLVLPAASNGNEATATISAAATAMATNANKSSANETTTTNNAAAAPDSSGTSEGTKTNTSDETDGGKAATTTTASTKKCTFYDRLARPPWEGMDLVVADETGKTNTHTQNNNNNSTNSNSNSKQLVVLQGREASAAQSGDPHKLMDALAESLLEGPYTVIPAKQQLFAGVRPMVENLL
mmetsp:Transcript_20772/g.42241  ORF Transcript_20772/g.42241 Transcript_20772/m.42241 type:complete len:336 (+) Transcript_20772:119-1126(+)